MAIRDHELTLRVGLVSLAVLCSLVALLIVFDGCRSRSGLRATVYFEHLGGLREGAEVRLAGRKIGKVVALSLVPHHLAGRDHPLHGTGGVAAIIAIKDRYSSWAPYRGAYFIANKGVFGERYVTIGPSPDRSHRRSDEAQSQEQRPLAEGDEVRGIDPPHIDRVLWRSYGNLMIARTFLDDVAPEGRALARALRQLVETLRLIEGDTAEVAGARAALADLIAEAGAFYRTWASADLTWSDVTALARQGRQTMAAAQAAVATLREPIQTFAADLARLRTIGLPPGTRERIAQSIDRAEQSLATIEATLARAKELVAMLERGEGSIGALLHDPEFPEDAKQLGRIVKRHPWRLVGLRRPVASD
ncbi:MAG: MlaD family protein [Proteobacteria bacterium]|nr:MlaD family protein [Pseudomonadota bacterium]